ncbi:hypothetical protein ACHAWF_017768 [Thalassiosira exigua]
MNNFDIRNLDGPISSQVSQDPVNSRAKGRLICRFAAALCFVIFAAANISSGNYFNQLLLGDGDRDLKGSGASFQSFLSERNNCQTVYILGVEGSVHHGVTPIVEKLARLQVDPATGSPFEISYINGRLRGALFGFHKDSRAMDHPKLIRNTLKNICPVDGKKHVIIEDASFPSGTHDDPRSYRIHRQGWWAQASMEDVSVSNTAMNHPTNLYSFVKQYAPHVEIKFIVLHRSYIETVASHPDFDGTVEQHSNVIGAYMLLLRRFLDEHRRDKYSDEKLWTLVCTEQIMSKSDDGDDEQRMTVPRQRVVTLG